jgi:hypothetical protein
MDDLSELRIRLAETIAWSSARSFPGVGRLRTAELRPSLLGPLQSDTMGEWGDADIRRSVVETVADERARLLHAAGGYPQKAYGDLAGGRLLLYAPDDNLFDGAAEFSSQGFFDVNNAPPWDTWVCYVRDSEQERQIWAGYERYEAFSVLVSWVPPSLLKPAHEGIWANPEQCIAWADTVDCTFTRSLVAAGLLEMA